MKTWNDVLLKYHGISAAMWLLATLAKRRDEPIGSEHHIRANEIYIENGSLSNTEANKLSRGYGMIKGIAVLRIKQNYYLINPDMLPPLDGSTRPFTLWKQLSKGDE